MNLQGMPSGLSDVKMLVEDFPYKFVLDFTGNVFCEDLINIWNYQFRNYGIKTALDVLENARAKVDIYPVGNWLQRWLTARWLLKQLTA